MSVQVSEIVEPVRGARSIRRDAGGRLVEIIKADGERVRLQYDEQGRIERVDAADAWFEARMPCAGDPIMHVLDARGTTDVAATDEAWSIIRNGAELSVQSNADGRPLRVRIPGCPLPLEFRYTQHGCRLQYGGRTLARLVETADRVRWRVASFALERTCEQTHWQLGIRNGRDDSAFRVEVWTDLLGRTVRRVWNDGCEQSFSRDTLARLLECRTRHAAAAEWQTRRFRYHKSELVEVAGDDGLWRRKVDDAGRVIALTRPDGSRIAYEYDARGRRSSRIDGEAVTRYSYDGLDRLVAVELPDGQRVTAAYDGLGRRIEVRSDDEGPEAVRLEHRDAGGRLWAVTDGRGNVLVTYVWFDDAPLLHFHGTPDAAAVTAYLCDPCGTPLMVAHVDEAERGRVERLPLPPYGRTDSASTPTLYGHFADPRTRLIHFGARDFDPETHTFLTPDPWHGGADDERLLGGMLRGSPGWMREYGAAKAHDYALCRFDPVGRVDADGHLSKLRALLNLILGPTWGMPLTSVSLFVMMPINIYAEILARIIQLIPGLTHPWSKHSIFGLRGLLASSRQGQLSLALNGLLPRAGAVRLHLSQERAVTVGNVVWIRPHELNVMNRPTVIEVEDLSGAGGGTAFNRDTSKASIVVMEVTDSDGKLKLHTTYWTRGFGNSVRTMGAAPNLTVAFEDEAAGGKRTGTLLLSQPFPYEYSVPTSSDSRSKLFLREMLHDGTHKQSRADVVEDVWIVLKLEQKKAKLKNGDAIEIEAPAGIVPAAHAVIGKLQDVQDFTLVFLFGTLPARFQVAPAVKAKMVVHRILDDTSAPAIADWQPVGPSKVVLEASEPAAGAGKPWPPDLAADALVKIKATTAAIIPNLGFPAPPPFDTAHARLSKLTAALEVADALPAGLAGAIDVLLQQSKGKVQSAKLKDIAKPLEIEFVANPDAIALNDRIAVRFTPAGAAAEVETYARIDVLNGKKVTVAYLMPAPAFTAPTDLRVQKLVDRTEKDAPKGKTNAPSGTQFDVEVPRFRAFDTGAIVHLKSGGTEAIRKVKRIAKATIELTDEVIGQAPYTLSLAKRDSGLCCIKDAELPQLRRFLRVQPAPGGGPLPSTYGAYPDFILEVSANVNDPRMSAFFVRGAPANLDAGYKLTWSPLQFGPDEYFVLDSDLPIVEDDKGFLWRFDPDEPERRFRLSTRLPGTPFTMTVREFQKSGTERGAPPNSLTAHAGEVLVPAEPRFRHALGDALAEHEQNHTVQGNRYGLLLSGLPLQGLLFTITDFTEMRDDPDAPGWFKAFFESIQGETPGTINWAEFLSYAGIMKFAWQHLFLRPAFFSESARKSITESNFNSWNRLFNPLWGKLIAEFPSIDPTSPIQDGNVIESIVRLAARASDLRMWTWFGGLVPWWLPDSAQNFIEQGASRMSGDLYSAILSTDDRFNAKLRFWISDSIVADDTDANIEKPMGSVFRLMLYPAHRTQRTFALDRADQPADSNGPVAHNAEFLQVIDKLFPQPATVPGVLPPDQFEFPDINPLAEIRAPKDTLFHPELYELRNISVRRALRPPKGPPPAPQIQADVFAYGPAPAVPATLQIEGPPSNPAPVDFIVFPDPATPGNDRVFMQPTLRSLVPLPPRVMRTAGLYFIPAQPAVYNCDSYTSDRHTDEFAETQKVKLTVSGTVLLGKTLVDWVQPTAHPAIPAAPSLDVFVTERLPLVMKQKGGDVIPTKGFEERFDVVTGPAPKAKLSLEPKQWELVAGDAAAKLRIRLYRIVKKNDRTDDTKNDPAFDLQFADVAQLKNVRSYLDKDLWVLVRDFIVEVKALPPLPPKTVKYDASVDVDMPLEIDAAAIVVTPPPGAPRLPNPEKKEPVARGHKWRFGPLDKIIEDNVVYPVEVTFGKLDTIVKSNFNLTVEPIIRLVAGGAFEATMATPLELTIQGGTPAYSLSTKNLPAGAQAQLDAGAGKVKITVTAAPPAPANAEIAITDSNGKKGRRIVTVK